MVKFGAAQSSYWPKQKILDSKWEPTTIGKVE